MLLSAAILGWLVALVLAVLRWRHVCHPRKSRVYQPVTTTGSVVLPMPGRITAELYAADGTLESTRQIKGEPPKTISRPHGKGPATRYTHCWTRDGRAGYRAES